MNAVIYARYSSAAQHSIEWQIETCEKYAKTHKYNVVKVYKDEAMTGRNDQRPGLQRLIYDSMENTFQAVIVYAIDRFGRDIQQSLNNSEKLKKNGVVLLATTDNYEDTPMGNLWRHFNMAQAQYESAMIGQRVTKGLYQNAKNGLANGGVTPFGYKVVNKRYQADPDTAPFVKKIFEMYASGERIVDICEYLNVRGVKTAKGVDFNGNSLHVILSNKKYIGIYKYKDIEIPDSVPRLITDELFDEVADRMKKNKKNAGSRKANEQYILSSKLFCGTCKSPMVGEGGRSAHGDRAYYAYYKCKNAKKKLKTCDRKSVQKKWIEDLVIGKCLEMLTDENIEIIADEVVNISKREDNGNLERLNKTLKLNEKKRKTCLKRWGFVKKMI